MSGHPVVWILVADGAHARVMVPNMAEGCFRTLLQLGTAEYPHTPPLLQGAVHARHRHHFTDEVAERLTAEARQGAFDQLVLVGPSHVVHDVRARLGDDAASCVIGTVMRDTDRLSDHDLSPLLARWWQEPAELV